MKLGLSTYSLDGEISSGRMTLGDVWDWIGRQRRRMRGTGALRLSV